MQTPNIYVFFSDSNSWWSGPIKWATDGIWSHTGIIFQGSDGVRVMYEAIVESGVVKSPMLKLREMAVDPKKRVVVVPLDPYVFNYTDGQVNACWQYCDRSVGRRAYGTFQLARMLLFESFNLPVGKSARKVVCSELVARTLDAGKIFDARGIRNPEFDTVNPYSLWVRLAERAGGVDGLTLPNARGFGPLHPLLADKDPDFV